MSLHEQFKQDGANAFPMFVRRLNAQNINEVDADGQTYLSIAVQRKNIELVKALLAKGANPNLADKHGNTPLHYAMNNIQEDIALLLVQKRAELTSRNQNGDTPIHKAAQHGSNRILQALLNDLPKSKRDELLLMANNQGQIPLECAQNAQPKQPGVVYWLRRQTPTDRPAPAVVPAEQAAPPAPLPAQPLVHIQPEQLVAKPAVVNVQTQASAPIVQPQPQPAVPPVVAAAPKQAPAPQPASDVQAIQPVPAPPQKQPSDNALPPLEVIPNDSPVAARPIQAEQPSVLDAHVYHGQLPNMSLYTPFQQQIIPADGDCGFHALNTTRQVLADTLLKHKQDPDFRDKLVEEIQSAWMSGDITSPATQGEQVYSTWLTLQSQYDAIVREIKSQLTDLGIEDLNGDTLIKALKSHGYSEDAQALSAVAWQIDEAKRTWDLVCQTPDIYETYVNALGQSLWLGYKSALLYAKAKGLNLYLWHEDSKNNNRLTLIEHTAVNAERGQPQAQTLHLLHTGAFTHFNRLIVTGSPVAKPPRSESLKKPKLVRSKPSKLKKLIDQSEQDQKDAYIPSVVSIASMREGYISNAQDLTPVPTLTTQHHFETARLSIMPTQSVFKTMAQPALTRTARTVQTFGQTINLPTYNPYQDEHWLQRQLKSLLIADDWLRFQQRLDILSNETNNPDFNHILHRVKSLLRPQALIALPNNLPAVLPTNHASLLPLNRAIDRLTRYQHRLSTKPKAEPWISLRETLDEMQRFYQNYRFGLTTASLEERRAWLSTPVTLWHETFGHTLLEAEHVPQVIVLNDVGQVAKPIKAGTSAVISYKDMHFKFQPIAPGVEYAVDALNKLAVGHGSPPTFFLKMQSGAMPYYVLASKTIEGKLLQSYMNTPETWTKTLSSIPLAHFAQLVAMSLLVNHQDAKPDNFIVYANGEQLTLTNIDNDLAFSPPVIFNDAYNQHAINTKNILYFLPAMHSSLPDAFKKWLSSSLCSPANLVFSWLNELSRKEQTWLRMKNKGTWTEQELARFKLLNLPFPQDTAWQIYERSRKMRQLVASKQNITLWQLFEALSPLEAACYQALRKKANTPQELLDVMRGMNQENRAFMLDRILSPEQVLANGRTVSQELKAHTYPKMSETKQLTTSVRVLQDTFLETIDYRKLSRDEQREIIEQLLIHGQSLTHLSFRHCSVLSGDDLSKIAQNFTQLRKIRLLNCNTDKLKAGLMALLRNAELELVLGDEECRELGVQGVYEVANCSDHVYLLNNAQGTLRLYAQHKGLLAQQVSTDTSLSPIVKACLRYWLIKQYKPADKHRLLQLLGQTESSFEALLLKTLNGTALKAEISKTLGQKALDEMLSKLPQEAVSKANLLALLKDTERKAVLQGYLNELIALVNQDSLATRAKLYPMLLQLLTDKDTVKSDIDALIALGTPLLYKLKQVNLIEPAWQGFVKGGNQWVIQSLLRAGNPLTDYLLSYISASWRDEEGKTPLHLTAYYGQLPAAQLLLERGAHINAVTTRGQTALDLAHEGMNRAGTSEAAKQNYLAFIDKLSAAGAKRGSELTLNLRQVPASIPVIENDAQTRLHALEAENQRLKQENQELKLKLTQTVELNATGETLHRIEQAKQQKELMQQELCAVVPLAQPVEALGERGAAQAATSPPAAPQAPAAVKLTPPPSATPIAVKQVPAEAKAAQSKPSSLLDSIRKGVKLKSKKKQSVATAMADNSIFGQMRAAISRRRELLKEDEEQNDHNNFEQLFSR